MRTIKLIAVLLAALLLCACGSAETEKKASEEKRGEPAQRIEWTPVYNDHQCGIQANRTQPEGLVQKALTDTEIQSVVPAELLTGTKTTGTAYFMNGKVFEVILHLQLQEGTATISLGNDVKWSACCMSLGTEIDQQESICGEVTYRLFRQLKMGGIDMHALGDVNGVPILVRIDSKNAQNDKVVFERILEAFSRVKGTSLTLSEIKPN